MMPSRNLSTLGSLVVAAATLVSTGCVYSKAGFRHERDRKAYSISEEELRDLQFYVSTTILVHPRDAKKDDGAASPAAILLPADSPGEITEVGENWLRVSFHEGYPGLLFLAGGDDESGDFYYLATEMPGSSEYHRASEVDSDLLLQQGWAYDIVYGKDAILLVEQDDVTDLEASREP